MIVRGDTWAVRLQQRLPGPPADMTAWMRDNTRLLKSDAASEVGLLELEGQLCCLKYYRHKSILHRTLFRAGRGRPVRSFDAALALVERRVAVPRPLACLRVPGGMLLLTQGIPDAKALDLLWQGQPGDEQVIQPLCAAGTVLADLHRAGYAHGDSKWRNILWSGQVCYLVDLDAASRARVAGARQARDLARFTLDAEELAMGSRLFDLFLDSYLSGIGRSRDEVVAATLPPLRKLRARHLARYGRRGQRLFSDS